MSGHWRILAGLWPFFVLLPLLVGGFEYQSQVKECRWGQQEQVSMLARALAEMARTDGETCSRFLKPVKNAVIPARVVSVLALNQDARVLALGADCTTVAFDSASRRETPPVPEYKPRLKDPIRPFETAGQWRAWAPVPDESGRILGYLMAEIPVATRQVTRKVMRDTAWRTAGSALVGLILCLILGAFFRREIERLQPAGGSAANSAPGGAKFNRIMEIEDLGNAFDTMHSLLREAMEKTLRVREAAMPETALVRAFAEEFVRPDSSAGSHGRSEIRRAGLAAGHFYCLDRQSGRGQMVMGRVEGVDALASQVAADAAAYLAEKALSEGLSSTLAEMAGLFSLQYGAAAELQEGTELAVRWRYTPDQGWQSESLEAAPLILHTFADPGLVRNIENYVLFWGDQDAGQLADELVELALAAKSEGLVAVIVRI